MAAPMRHSVNTLLVGAIIVAILLLLSRPWKEDEIVVIEVPATMPTNSASAKAITNDRPTEAVDKLIAQTNGLVRVHDVGGTVSYQSVSSKTSAPVAPENPYLNKK